MDYEKKYKEALKAAAVVHKDLERIFPELKKSEDSEDAILDNNEDGLITETIKYKNKKQDGKKPADNIESSTFKNKLLELFQRFRWYCKDKIPTNGDIIEYVDAHIQELIGTTQEPSWSEEDEEMWLDAIKYLELFDAQGIHGNKAVPCINWLKSLRPQKQWKPSEEQMKALNYVVNLMASSESPKENDYYYNVFKDLRKQLKKLRKE